MLYEVITIQWIRQEDEGKAPLLASMAAADRERLRKGGAVHLKRLDGQGNAVLYTFMPLGNTRVGRGILQLRQSPAVMDNYTHTLLFRGILVTSFLGCIYGVILYVFMNRSICIPLRRLIDQVERIGSGDLCTTVAFKGNDELARLAQTLNEMCSRLLIAKEKIKFECDARLKTLEQLRHTERLSTFGLLSAGIAHEIGTPLNVVDGRAKMIIQEELSPEEIRECASIIQHQAERMTVIIRQLLDFTKRPKNQLAITKYHGFPNYFLKRTRFNAMAFTSQLGRGFLGSRFFRLIDRPICLTMGTLWVSTNSINVPSGSSR